MLESNGVKGYIEHDSIGNSVASCKAYGVHDDIPSPYMRGRYASLLRPTGTKDGKLIKTLDTAR